jgi:hypothetical protein
LAHELLPPLAGPLDRETRLTGVAQLLAARGYRNVHFNRAAAAMSSKPADRLELVEGLLTSSGRDATNWLLLMARDESPQVRRSAILALVTSRDRNILELTRELALRDLDPQVAELAPQIENLLR